jgi:hypothetical protein
VLAPDIDFRFGLVLGLIDFRHGIAHEDHPIVVFDATSDGR